MPLVQSIEGAREQRVGAHGLDDKAYDDALARSSGALDWLRARLMHFMLETIIAAHLLGVDPFDQPAVEEGKVLAKKYLAGGA